MGDEFIVHQNLFIEDFPPIRVRAIDVTRLDVDIVQSFLDTVSDDNIVGVSAIYGKKCSITSIAFSSSRSALVVRSLKNRGRGARLIGQHILCNPCFHKCSFEMDATAVALFMDVDLRICNGVNLLSRIPGYRGSLETLMNAMGGETCLQKTNVVSLFFSDTKGLSFSDAAIQAWAAYRAGTTSNITPIPRIDTEKLTKEQLQALTRIFRDANLLESMQPTEVKNDVRSDYTMKKGKMNLTCKRFRTRIRQSHTQSIVIETLGEGSDSVVGRATRVRGRTAQITLSSSISGKIRSVRTIGKEEPSFADIARQDILLNTLQGVVSLLSGPFFLSIWLPHQHVSWPKQVDKPIEPLIYFPARPLNPSQKTAIQKILSPKDEDRLVVIQGPPGTGKTTVIAASVLSVRHQRPKKPIWIAAQSNVAVKNIAEKLSSVAFLEFRILISFDFHFDWHEHLYQKLQPLVIRSDDFADNIILAERQLRGARVILCTLTMLSHLRIKDYLRLVPMDMVIFDEASQIEVGNYIPVIHQFATSLRKMVFIGDDKQLAPYGQEDIRVLRSIFEFSHLRKNAIFLDTQYRLPHVIGNFVSQQLYEGKLITSHSIQQPSACRFIDVRNGYETKHGHSWVNQAEAIVVIHMARVFQRQRKSFRVITPYDAQRTAIEAALKHAKLNWENKVFNVDSFQGNEDDQIIVSVVRTKNIGFLENERRTNVMLTRCKHRMVICTHRTFMESAKTSRTLLGRFAAQLGPMAWVSARDVINGRFV